MPPKIEEASARAWMRGARELAVDEQTGRVLADELAERCALAFGLVGEGGPLNDAQHWLHRIAREVAAEETQPRTATQRTRELAVIRMRSNGRTYWMVTNGETTRTYSPHISQRYAVTRYESELHTQHELVTVHREQHRPEQAARLIAELRSKQ